jgi:ribonuclease HI
MGAPAPQWWSLSCDGGARGNPGPGAMGYVLVDPAGTVREERARYLGRVTNNVAEYSALIGGLEAARRHEAHHVRVQMDSELVVRQMTGAYRVKNSGLKPLHAEATRLATQFERLEFTAVPREHNDRADALVNEVLDAMGDPVPESPR